MGRTSPSVAVAALMLVAAAGASACAPAPLTPPPTDSCTTPTTGNIDTVEVGAASAANLAGQPTTFVPLADGDGLTLIRGGQGATMLGFILRVSGAAAPSCLGQETLITDSGGARVTSSTPPLTTYAQTDGTRLTHPMWLPADYPTSFVIDVTALDKSLALHLHLDP